MWSGPLHNKDFVSKALEHLEANKDKYGTAPRMEGMLTVAKAVRINILRALVPYLISW